MCEWKCPHAECNHPCYEFCDRKACNEPCPKMLFCGHPCNGLNFQRTVKFAHLNVCLVLSSKCLRKTRQPGTCHLIKYFHSEVTILFDLDTSTWSVNTGSKWKKWTNGFIIATVKRRLPESNARLVQHAPSPSNCASVTGTGSNPFTST